MTKQPQKQRGRGLHRVPGRSILLLLQRSGGLPLILFVGFVSVALFVSTGRWPRKHGLGTGRAVDARCTAAAISLVSARINLLALDFDLTIIDRHTGGRWTSSPKKLRKHVRPALECLLNAAMDRGIYVAVVTFSEQEELISNVMNQVFPGRYIPVRGWLDEKGGKQEHMAKASKDIMSHLHEDAIISEKTTMLIDDDRTNIKIAIDRGYPAIAFDPDNPSKVFENIRLFAEDMTP